MKQKLNLLNLSLDLCSLESNNFLRNDAVKLSMHSSMRPTATIKPKSAMKPSRSLRPTKKLRPILPSHPAKLQREISSSHTTLDTSLGYFIFIFVSTLALNGCSLFLGFSNSFGASYVDQFKNAQEISSLNSNAAMKNILEEMRKFTKKKNNFTQAELTINNDNNDNNEATYSAEEEDFARDNDSVANQIETTTNTSFKDNYVEKNNNAKNSNFSNSNPPNLYKRTFLTQDEILQKLLSASNDNLFITSPFFTFSEPQETISSGGFNASVKIAGFSGGVDLSMNKIIRTEFRVSIHDPDLNYYNLGDQKVNTSAAIRNGQRINFKLSNQVNQIMEPNIAKERMPEFWAKRMMIFNCAVEESIDFANRKDLAIEVSNGKSSIVQASLGAKLSSVHAIKFSQSFITSSIAVPLGIITKNSNPNARKKINYEILTSFKELKKICHNTIPQMVNTVLDNNLRAELQSVVLQSSLTTCDVDQDCVENNQHWFTKSYLSLQSRRFRCLPDAQLVGVKSCTKVGLQGASCSNEKNSTLPICDRGLKCNISQQLTTFTVAGLSPSNKSISSSIGSCQKIK